MDEGQWYPANAPQTTSVQPDPTHAKSSWIARTKTLMNSLPGASSGLQDPVRKANAPPVPPEGKVNTGTFSKRKITTERPKAQNISYERYSMSKPALLEEIKSHIDRGVRTIQKCSSDKDLNDELTTRLKTLNIYREGLQKFIDECNIYRPVLSSIKHEYEKTLDFYSSNFNSVISLHAQLAAKDAEYTNEKKKMHEQHAEHMNTLVDQRLAVQRAFNNSKKEQNRVTTDHDRMQKTYANMKRQLDEAQNSISSMSVALTRAEAERTVALQQKADVEAELLEMKNTFKKTQENHDRLRQQVQDLESVQSQMVGLDVVMSYAETIRELKSRYKELETNHNEIIQRYADIKIALEHSFERHAANFGSGDTPVNSSLPLDGGVRVDVKEIEKNPVKMVEKMNEMNVNPRVIIEFLLDCIKNLRKEGGSGAKSGDIDRRGMWKRMGLSAFEGTPLKEDAITPEDHAFVSPWTHFEGKGMDPSIPPYLRTVGLVQNVYLSKRDTEMVINDIWIAREEMVKKEQERVAATKKATIKLMPFDEFFYEYIQKRFKGKNRLHHRSSRDLI